MEHPAAAGPAAVPAASAAATLGSPVPTTTLRNAPRWPGFAALAVALIALGLAIAGWFRPIPVPRNASTAPATHTFTEQQIAAAKANVCAAYRRVSHSIDINTNGTAPPASDRIATLAVATNARLALHAGANYLADVLITNPATPTDLTQTVHSLSREYQELTLIDLAGESESSQQAIRKSIDWDMTTLDRLCGD